MTTTGSSSHAHPKVSPRSTGRAPCATAPRRAPGRARARAHVRACACACWPPAPKRVGASHVCVRVSLFLKGAGVVFCGSLKGDRKRNHTRFVGRLEIGSPFLNGFKGSQEETTYLEAPQFEKHICRVPLFWHIRGRLP